MTKRISVIGSGSCGREEAIAAERVGTYIAKEKAVLVCGGLGGVMRSAAKGAKKAGGLVIGVLPGSSSDMANPYIDIPIVTGMGEARNLIVALSCDAVIAIGGKFGTLSEIAFALKNGIPVIGLKTWCLDKKHGKNIKIIRAPGPKEAVKLAVNHGG